MEKGLIHIYCGDGKGKTSAATGLAVRAAGCGKQVLFARFLKNEESGELEILDRIPEIHVIHLERSFGFYCTLTEEEQAEVRRMYKALWHDIVRRAETDAYDVLVMDEFMAAYNRANGSGDDLTKRMKRANLTSSAAHTREIEFTDGAYGNTVFYQLLDGYLTDEVIAAMRSAIAEVRRRKRLQSRHLQDRQCNFCFIC